MLYYLLYPLSDSIGAFRVFRYISFRTAGAILTAIFISFMIGPSLIRWLQTRQIGQVIREDGPQSHLSKKGTPTMGGILILLSITLATMLWARLDNTFICLAIVVLWGMGGVGFADDYIKLRIRKKGLSSGQKMSLQFVVAIITTVLFCLIGGGQVSVGHPLSELARLAHFDTRLFVPFFKGVNVELGWFFLFWMIFIMIGSSNAVNLTDGLDGLAIGPVITASMTFALLSYLVGHVKIADYLNINYVPHAGEMAVFCGALFGAGLGFLWYNTYPAQVFMGDVGALSIGGVLGFIAIVIKQEILWAIVGGIFVIETLSVVMQVASFKLTGKRIFKMAPLHHHFELKGWAEPKVIVRFWIISIILSLVALSSLKLR